MRIATFAPHLILAVSAIFLLGACSKAPPGSSSEGFQGSSSFGLPSGDIAEGEKRALVKGIATGQSCIDCHGQEGDNPLISIYPRLAGQYADYIAYSLLTYRDGSRQHPLMTPQAANLSGQDISNLAAYFSSRKGKLRDLREMD